MAFGEHLKILQISWKKLEITMELQSKPIRGSALQIQVQVHFLRLVSPRSSVNFEKETNHAGLSRGNLIAKFL